MKEAVVCSTHIVYNLIFFSLKKLRGPQGGPEGDPDGGPEGGPKGGPGRGVQKQGSRFCVYPIVMDNKVTLVIEPV